MTLGEGLTALLLLTGAFFMLMGAVGIVRLPDLFMRMSATTKSLTLGVSFMMLAVALHFNDLAVGARALATILFVFLTAPVAAHLIARAGYRRGVSLWQGTVSDELRGRYDEQSGELASGAPDIAPPQSGAED